MASAPNAVPPSPGPGITGRLQRSRSLEFASFAAAIVWFFCAEALSQSAARGLSLRFDLSDFESLIEAVFLLFLLLCGLSLLRSIEQRRAPLRLTLGLPKRTTAREEWATGAAIGWGLAIASVLPMALARNLSIQVWTAPRAFFLLILSLLVLAITTLANTLGIYGYAFQRLIDAIGPVRATLIIVALSAMRAGFPPSAYINSSGARVLVAMLASMLFCICWFRTHGLWLLWGVQFAWAASTAALFGLPVNGDVSLISIVDTRAAGPAWLTGGAYGPAATLAAILVLVVAIPVLLRVTDDYAWKYTHPPIIPAGYEVNIPPPATHASMEDAADRANSGASGSLVQILPATPSAAPVPGPDASPE